MATTTNFGWETPDDTDLVKDGAAAIRTLGNSIDTSMVDLKGGTTGQVLSKNSNTDMDFTWVAQDDSNAIQNAIVDAKGDLIAASGADTPARLAVGTNEHRLVADSAETTGLKYVADTTNYAIAAKGDLLVGTAADTLQALTVGTNGYTLVADSATSTGLKWAAPASSQKNWTLLNAGGTSLTGATTITVSGISGADAIMVLVQSGSGATAGAFLSFRFNTDSNNNYYPAGLRAIAEGTYGAGFMRAMEGTATNEIRFTRISNNAGGNCGAGLIMTGCNASGVKVFNATGSYYSSASNQDAEMYAVNGIYNSSSTISSVSVISSSGNWDNGTVFVYTTA